MNKLITTTVNLFLLLFPLLYLPIGNTAIDYDKQIILFIFSALLFLLMVIKTVSSKKITLAQTPFDGLFLLLALFYLLSSLLISPNKMESLLSPMGAASMFALTILYFSLTQYFSTGGRETYGRTLTLAAIILSLPLIARQFNPNINIFPLGSYYSTALFLAPLVLYVILNLFQDLPTNKKSFRSVISHFSLLLILVTSLSLSLYHLFTDQKSILLPPTAGWAILLDSYKNIPHFLLGVGPNNFSSAYALGKPLFLNSTPFWNGISFVSSSYLFTLATEVGILGLLILLILGLKIIRLCRSTLIIKRGGASAGSPKIGVPLREDFGAGERQDPYIKISKSYLLPLTISFLILLFLPIQLPHLILITVLLASAAPQQIRQFSFPAAKKFTVYLIIILLAVSVGLLYWPLKSYASDFFIRQSLLANNPQFLGDALNFSQKAIELNPYSERAYSLSSSLSLEALRNIVNQTSASDSADLVKFLTDQAISHARKTTELNPAKSENWGLLGDTYQALSGIAENANVWALNSYNQQILLNPSSPQAKLSAGGLSMTTGDYETAALLFRQAITLKPDWNNAHYNLAVLYTKTGSYNYAIVELQKTLSYTPVDSLDYAQVSRDLQSLQNLFNQPASPSANF